MNRLKDHTWGKRHDFLSKNHPGDLHENKRHSVTFFSSVYITNKRDPVLQSLVKIHSPAHSSHISSVNQPLYSLDLKVEGLSKKPTFFVNADKNFALSLATHRQIVSCDVQVFLMKFVSKEVQKPLFWTVLSSLVAFSWCHSVREILSKLPVFKPWRTRYESVNYGISNYWST